MKILIAYDGSEGSQKALTQAIELARYSKHAATVLAVREPSITFQYSGNVPFSDPDLDTGDMDIAHIRERLEAREREHWEGILNGAKELCVEAGLACETLYEIGDPRTTILEVAKREDVDLLVMGSRGLGAVKRLLLGSVSEYVMHHATCSVLITRLENA
mgnify:CR=1 FL=1